MFRITYIVPETITSHFPGPNYIEINIAKIIQQRTCIAQNKNLRSIESKSLPLIDDALAFFLAVSIISEARGATTALTSPWAWIAGTGRYAIQGSARRNAICYIHVN